MDFDTQLSTEHLFMESRVCRVCREEKTLLADFYKCRPDGALRSSYAYECKDCAKKRVLKNYHSNLGTCVVCGETDTKLIRDRCKSCNKVLKEVKGDISILKKMVEYLEKK